MERFRKILVVVGGDPAARDAPAAPGQAAALAGPGASALKLIAVVEDLSWLSRLVAPSSQQVRDALIRRRAEQLEVLAAPLRREGLEVTTRVLHGHHPDLEMVREVERDGHDLLIKDAEPGRSAAIGPRDLRLLRHCPCPVWLVHPAQRDRPPRRILAAVNPAPTPDPTEEVIHLRAAHASEAEALNESILELATWLAGRAGAELHVLHAWLAPGEAMLRQETMVAPEQVDAYVDDLRAEAQQGLDRLLARVPAGTGRRAVHLIQGDAAETITGFVRAAGVDLLVMGTVIHSGFGLWVGHTAESILHQVDSSVVALRPGGLDPPAARA
jgi:universal stress protein E